MLRKEINAVFNRKLSGIDIEKDKISKKYQYHFFSLFVQIAIDFVDYSV